MTDKGSLDGDTLYEVYQDFDEVRNVLDSLSDHEGEDQRRIAVEGLRWLDLILRKNRDYGSAVFKIPVLAPTTQPGEAILVRMSDKIERLRNLLERGKGDVDESIEETMRDLGAYALLWLVRPTTGDCIKWGGEVGPRSLPVKDKTCPHCGKHPITWCTTDNTCADCFGPIIPEEEEESLGEHALRRLQEESSPKESKAKPDNQLCPHCGTILGHLHAESCPVVNGPQPPGLATKPTHNAIP